LVASRLGGFNRFDQVRHCVGKFSASGFQVFECCIGGAIGRLAAAFTAAGCLGTLAPIRLGG